MLSAADIRQQFIDYFVKKCGHTFVPSSPCVPLDDPTLMFANAGMNQFKPIFLGQQAPDVDKWPGVIPGMPTRAANTQKCIRAGGKHNDLDDVGHDTYHHTFFEMLGNWSFGDYFKKEAIEWAWDLLTNVWGLDPDRLHATYFQGDASEGLEPDTEARDLWLKILPPERVHPGNKKDNFWEMGDTGPCGPCSEIHIDLTPDKSGGKLVNAGDARVMEIWNLVFIQFNRGGDGKLTPLPARHVDTGMGFERICSVIQGMQRGRLGQFSNYDTDVFTPIFEAIQQVTGAPAYTGLLETDETPKSQNAKTPKSDSGRAEVMKDVAYRVVADHIRTLTFALTDGAVPSNEGRGYVLRRILRRAVRYGRQYLGTREPFLCRLVPAVAQAMGLAFPELNKAHGGRNVEHVASLIRDEEASFIKTLDRGIALFNEAAEYARTHHHGRISGADAFKLHDTYGFPIDLTELMAEEQSLTVDIGEYERLMEEAREKARGSSKRLKDPFGAISPDELVLLGRCDDSPKYDVTLRCNARIVFLRDIADGDGGRQVLFATDRTCFYAEQGGQVGDTGTVRMQTGEVEVLDVQRRGEAILHVGRVTSGHLVVGQDCQMQVSSRRESIMRHHTATHLLNWALREVLGTHVEQKGSLVDDQKTRFDFSHAAQLTEEELRQIETLVNDQIVQDLPVQISEVDEKRAREINTLRAVFGEKYPPRVRVVSIGPSVDKLLSSPNEPEWMKYSVEFCGGTHVDRTKRIGRFHLVEESAVAKGIRRLVGVSGDRAYQVASAVPTELFERLAEARNVDGVVPSEILNELQQKLSGIEIPLLERIQLRSMLATLQENAKKAAKQQAKSGASDVLQKTDELLTGAKKAGSVSIICGALHGANADQLRAATDSLRARAGSAAVLLASDEGGKVTLLAAMTPDVVQKGVKAGDLIKEIAPVVGGKGGGRPDMAQGGGPETGKIADAVSAAQNWLAKKLA